jgi:sarcosine oxidase subunit beta
MNDFTADVIVIGGGIAGTSIALRLAEKGRKVILLEKGRVGEEASGRNGGGVRQQDRRPEELPLAMAAIKFWEGMQDELGCDVGYRQGGNLMIARSERQLESLIQIKDRELAMGLHVEMLSPEETLSITPSLAGNFEIFGSKYCPSDGTANPLLVVKAISRLARSIGVRIKEHEPVRKLMRSDEKVTAAITDNGAYRSPVFVLAAGPWARSLCNTIGFDLPITVRKSRLMVTEPLPHAVDQFVILDKLYYRQTLEGNIHIGGLSPHGAEDFDKSVLFKDFVEVFQWLPRNLPFFRNVNIIRAFAGLTQNTADTVAILDKAPGLENLFLAVGFSGHGFCLGPIVGKLIAEWIVDGRSSIDLSKLRLNRFNIAPP